MKKVFLASTIIALGLALSNCGSDTDSLIDKFAEFTKFRNQLTQKGANLDTANKKVNEFLAMKAELSKKLKDNCESGDLKKLNALYDCQIVELKKLVMNDGELKETVLDMTCIKPKLSDKCQTVIDEIKGKMAL